MSCMYNQETQINVATNALKPSVLSVQSVHTCNYFNKMQKTRFTFCK